jgi:ribosome maturation factor RimP
VNPIVNKVIAIIEPACIAAGYELVDVRFVAEQGGWVLRVCIDLPPDQAPAPFGSAPLRGDLAQDRQVDLKDCERMSRELSALLDVEDPIPQAYNLEVSSPGIDRPLRTAAHFARFAGAEAKIHLAVPLVTPTGERRNFKGVLRGVEDDRVVIDVDGQTFRLPIADVDTARLVPDWDEVMRNAKQHQQPQQGRN